MVFEKKEPQTRILIEGQESLPPAEDHKPSKMDKLQQRLADSAIQEIVKQLSEEARSEVRIVITAYKKQMADLSVTDVIILVLYNLLMVGLKTRGGNPRLVVKEVAKYLRPEVEKELNKLSIEINKDNRVGPLVMKALANPVIARFIASRATKILARIARMKRG